MGSIAIGDLSGTAELRERPNRWVGPSRPVAGGQSAMRQAPDDRDAAAQHSINCLAQSQRPCRPNEHLPMCLPAASPPSRRGPSIGSTTLAVPTFEECATPQPACDLFTKTTRPCCHRLPETMGGGLGLIDYDGDGWLDVYAVQGGKLPDDQHPHRHSKAIVSITTRVMARLKMSP